MRRDAPPNRVAYALGRRRLDTLSRRLRLPLQIDRFGDAETEEHRCLPSRLKGPVTLLFNHRFR
jgi:hypothetical protein